MVSRRKVIMRFRRKLYGNMDCDTWRAKIGEHTLLEFQNNGKDWTIAVLRPLPAADKGDGTRAHVIQPLLGFSTAHVECPFPIGTTVLHQRRTARIPDTANPLRFWELRCSM